MIVLLLMYYSIFIYLLTNDAQPHCHISFFSYSMINLELLEIENLKQ